MTKERDRLLQRKRAGQGEKGEKKEGYREKERVRDRELERRIE